MSERYQDGGGKVKRVADLETRIERGLETFVDVGLALLEIRGKCAAEKRKARAARVYLWAS
ncbi:MAG: hypothetical protein IIC64_13315 [SAR324 cluster bacterium]|nr:hypothetical protein [SAR324 cluster bacterium]